MNWWELFSPMTVKERALLQKKQRRDQSTHSPVATLILLKYLVPKEPWAEHGTRSQWRKSPVLLLCGSYHGDCAPLNTLVSWLHCIQPQNAGGGLKESLWYCPPRGHKQWEQVLGEHALGTYHELGVDEVNKGAFVAIALGTLQKWNIY